MRIAIVVFALLLALLPSCSVGVAGPSVEGERVGAKAEAEEEEEVPNVILESGVVMLEWVERMGGLEAFCDNATMTTPSEWNARWAQFLRTLCAVHVGERRRNNQGSMRVVVVVGAGPAGLLAALTAWRRGAHVVVVEKRMTYERDTWFDVSNGAWGDALDEMERWGIFLLEDELDVGEMIAKDDFSGQVKLGDILPIRCESLERFLAQTCFLLGLDMRYGVKFERMNEACTAALTSAGDEIPFDVIVGADGHTQESSTLREQLGIEEETVPNLRQMSLFLRFKQCPTIRESALDDWEVSIEVPWVVMVYRRFFSDQCDLQVLLDENAAHLIETGYMKAWDLLILVANWSLPLEFPTKKELRAAVTTDEPQIVVTPLTRSSVSTVCANPECKSVGVLVGDAVFPAHYRLGIGVNNAVDSMHNLGVFLGKLSTSGPQRGGVWRDLVAEKKSVDEKRMATVWLHQAQIMWLESYCGVHVFLDAKRVTLDQEEEEEQNALGYRPPVNVRDLYVVRTHRLHPMLKPRPGEPLGRVRMKPAHFSVVLSMDEATQRCERLLGKDTWFPAEDAGDEAARRVLADAEFHNPQSVIDVIDACGHQMPMMNVGDLKGELLSAEVQKLPPGACVLELGAFVGYSAVRMGRDLKQGARLVSVEVS